MKKIMREEVETNEKWNFDTDAILHLADDAVSGQQRDGKFPTILNIWKFQVIHSWFNEKPLELPTLLQLKHIDWALASN